MTDEKLLGWGYRQIGWLLKEVESAGAAIPERYRAVDPERFDIEAIREQDAVRRARLKAGQSISSAFTWESMYPYLTSDAEARKRAERAVQIEGQMRRAINGLRGDGALLALLSSRIQASPDATAGGRETFEAMEHMLCAVGSLRHELGDTAPLREPETTRQAFLYERLAEACREVLDVDPADGVALAWGAYHGPFVAFIRAAHALAGKPIQTDGAITKALQRSGFGKPKDKH